VRRCDDDSFDDDSFIVTSPDFASVPPDVATVFTVAAADGAVLPVYQWRAAPVRAAPALLFGHCTGFAAGSYRGFLDRIARHARVFAFDARGHGGATWPDGPLDGVFTVARFADDVLRIGEAVAARAGGPPHYAGHSLNARAALALEMSGGAPAWPSLTLFEPPIFPPPGAPDHPEAAEKQGRLIPSAARRVAQWRDHPSFAAFLKGRGVFSVFADADLANHVAATLRPDAGGGYRLCCPPAVEAATFSDVKHDVALWARLGTITRPLVIVRGDPALPERDWITGASPAIAARMPNARLVTLERAGHMMMFEQPERCVAIVVEQLRAHATPGITPHPNPPPQGGRESD
jgi:pimeloyl-ACP methyl ester carboxylesterase